MLKIKLRERERDVVFVTAVVLDDSSSVHKLLGLVKCMKI
jgi:hypothetical protein